MGLKIKLSAFLNTYCCFGCKIKPLCKKNYRKSGVACIVYTPHLAGLRIIFQRLPNDS